MPEPKAQPGDARLPVCLRIRRRREFERAFAEGQRLTDANLTLWAVPNRCGHPRLGLNVGRKHGGAVRRNRLKRLLREAFRLARPRLPGTLDLVCSPRLGADISLDTCVESLTCLAARLAERFASR